MRTKLRYSMLIQWSEEDQVFVVSLPEFGPYSKTHGTTYEEAAKNGREVLEALIDSYQAEGRDLPEPARMRAVTATVHSGRRKRREENTETIVHGTNDE
jgi:predicted RNase H-like HicB family nuclease